MSDPAIAGYGVVDGPPLPLSANNTVIANISGGVAYPVAVPLATLAASFPIVSGTTPVTGGTTNGILSKQSGVVVAGPATADSTGTITVPGSINVTGKLNFASAPGIAGNTTTTLEVNNGSFGTFRDLVLRTLFVGTTDTILNRAAAANLALGAADAAAPVAQTLSVQNVLAGTTNTAGANRTYDGSQGTGTGVGGSHIFRVAPAGSTGSAQNALAAALTIDSTKQLSAPGFLAVGGANSDPFARSFTNRLSLGSVNSGPSALAINGGAGAQAAIELGVNNTRAGTLQSDGTSITYLSAGTAIPVIFGVNGQNDLVISNGGNVAIRGALQLGNAYVAGAAVVTGTVTLKDSSGTTLRVLVANP